MKKETATARRRGQAQLDEHIESQRRKAAQSARRVREARAQYRKELGPDFEKLWQEGKTDG